MPSFEIRGVGKDTGRKRKKTFTAPTEKAAREQAEAAGIVVNQVTRLPDVPPTDGRLDDLQRLGYKGEPPKTQEKASELISSLEAKREKQYRAANLRATKQELRELKKEGVVAFKINLSDEEDIEPAERQYIGAILTVDVALEHPELMDMDGRCLDFEEIYEDDVDRLPRKPRAVIAPGEFGDLVVKAKSPPPRANKKPASGCLIFLVATITLTVVTLAVAFGVARIP